MLQMIVEPIVCREVKKKLSQKTDWKRMSTQNSECFIRNQKYLGHKGVKKFHDLKNSLFSFWAFFSPSSDATRFFIPMKRARHLFPENLTICIQQIMIVWNTVTPFKFNLMGYGQNVFGCNPKFCNPNIERIICHLNNIYWGLEAIL